MAAFLEVPQYVDAQSRKPLTPIFYCEFIPAAGAGALPAEAVPEACKKQGPTIAHFLI